MNDGWQDEHEAGEGEGADSLWAFDPEDEETPKPSPLPLVLLAIGVLAVIAVLVAVLAGGDGDDDKGQTAMAGGATIAGGAGSEAAADPTTCLRWPVTVDAVAEPPGAVAPGIHVWFDFTGWHLRRVPGEGVPGAVVTVVSTNAEHAATAGATGGGATATPGEAGAIVVTLPEGDQVSDAAFAVPFYANGVVIDFKDQNGQSIPTDQITGGRNEGPVAANPLTAERIRVAC